MGGDARGPVATDHAPQDMSGDRAAEEVDRLLEEYGATRDPAADPELEAVRAAVFVEDVFDVTLSDDEIDPAVLCHPAALRALLARRRGGS